MFFEGAKGKSSLVDAFSALSTVAIAASDDLKGLSSFAAALAKMTPPPPPLRDVEASHAEVGEIPYTRISPFPVSSEIGAPKSPVRRCSVISLYPSGKMTAWPVTC